MKNLNERQTKLIADLQDAFGKMNGSTTAKGRLLDIQSIRNMMDESESIKREVSLYNEKLIGEFRCKWTSELDMLRDDLEELGLLVEMYEDGSRRLCLSVKHKDSNGSNKPYLSNSIYIGGHHQFVITAIAFSTCVDLPNGEKINKTCSYQYEIGYATRNYYSSIEKLVNSKIFKEWINYSLVENNKYKK